jgi:hypothetical protein
MRKAVAAVALLAVRARHEPERDGGETRRVALLRQPAPQVVVHGQLARPVA